MTTNELKCPVCDKEMKLGEPETELYPALFSCENEECPIDEYFYEKDIQYINKAIQLRIDKEKAAAVQQERERIIKVFSDEREKNNKEYSRILKEEKWRSFKHSDIGYYCKFAIEFIRKNIT